MLRGRTYEEVCNNFKWEIPKYYNIGVDVSDKWAVDKTRLALIYIDPHGMVQKYTFKELSDISNQLANALKANEQYGQTECDLVVGFCSEVMRTVPGAIGRAVPGHVVEIINEDGGVAKRDELGEIAVKGPDPVMFLKYWKNPQATKEKFIGEWLRTGDFGQKDEKGVTPDKAFEESIKEHVKSRLEAHAYPREVEFLAEMPMTKTGKILKHELRKIHEAKKDEDRL